MLVRYRRDTPFGRCAPVPPAKQASGKIQHARMDKDPCHISVSPPTTTTTTFPPPPTFPRMLTTQPLTVSFTLVLCLFLSVAQPFSPSYSILEREEWEGEGRLHRRLKERERGMKKIRAGETIQAAAQQGQRGSPGSHARALILYIAAQLALIIHQDRMVTNGHDFKVKYN